MKVLRITKPDAIRPLHVVMICLVAMTVAGGSLLLSAAESQTLVDGAIEWHQESPLRAVVQLLCLNYQVPTVHAGSIKNYILGIGAGLAILSLSVAIVVRGRIGDEEAASDDALPAPPGPAESETQPVLHKPQIAPLAAAQALVGLYLLWSFASSRWSLAPELAVGGSILLTIQFLWAFGIGNGLSPSAARFASRVIVAVVAVTSIVAVWYYYGRNPTLRAKFPFGNPNFLSACLIPGILLVAALICENIARAVKTREIKSFGLIAVALPTLAVSLTAFYLAGSRGAAVGLVIGLLAMAFFGLRGRMKLVPAVLVVCLALGGLVYSSGAADAFSPTGRGTTIRLRTYAWSYAWRMFNEKPITGHGQSGFALTGDSYAVNDVLDDPLVFQSRIAHAHNEWLEIMADLGSVGIVLIAAALLLTLRAGAAALAASPPRGERWALLGLMGALVGLVVEEAFGVGLRVSGAATLFFTVIGLIWALSGYRMRGLPHHLSLTRGRRIVAGVVGGVVGLASLAVTQEDFVAARNSFRAGEVFFKGDYEEAARLASLAVDRLNAQRTLSNLYRLSEAHLRVADHLQDRARDRERRAHETDLPDRRLLALAGEDYRLSDARCEQGSGALKELVVRSPGYINHGRLEFRLNLTRARNAAAQHDVEKGQALLKNAVAAIQRELLRQPFDPSITMDYLYVAGSTLELPEMMEVLARPLRHHRISEAYLHFLRPFAADPDFDRHFEPLLLEARRALTSPPVHTAQHSWTVPPKDDDTGEQVETWAPEKLRVAAAVLFLRGDYQGAREILELAAPAYDALADSAPFGAASCYGELAICQFFDNPNDPVSALASASRAIALAPQSRLGRELQRSVRLRMVDYHLAADNEQEVKSLLRETGPRGVTEEAVLRELGARYRSLCESLLERREAGGILRKPPAELAPKLQRWAARAIELDPQDPFAHYLAADLAFYVGDADATVGHLKHAITHGLPLDLAKEFLQTAQGRRPESQALKTLWAALMPAEPVEGPPQGPEPSFETPPVSATPNQPSSNNPGR